MEARHTAFSARARFHLAGPSRDPPFRRLSRGDHRRVNTMKMPRSQCSQSRCTPALLKTPARSLKEVASPRLESNSFRPCLRKQARARFRLWPCSSKWPRQRGGAVLMPLQDSNYFNRRSDASFTACHLPPSGKPRRPMDKHTE